MDESSLMKIHQELLEKSKGPHLCNKRSVHALLITERGKKYYGRNGCEHDPCSKKSPNYCTRESGPAEYVTCPSFCAEGSAMLSALGLDSDFINAMNGLDLGSYLADFISYALFDKKLLKGSRIHTTGLPCPRCISMAVDAEISDIYFEDYKEAKPRDKDVYRAAELTSSDIKLHRIIRCVNEHGITEYVSKNIDPSPDIESFTVGKARTSGEAYIRMMFDKPYRAVVMTGANFLKENLEPFMKIDPDCLIFPSEWSHSRH